MTIPATIHWEDETLTLLDQTALPTQEVLLQPDSVEAVFEAIQKLRVRGAPAIGIAGAYGLVLAMQTRRGLSVEAFRRELQRQADYLNSARPTAVNLSWALRRLVESAVELSSSEAIYQRLRQEAEAIHAEDRQLCRGIGTHGLPLITAGCGVLTHCNAGALATSELGTATAPMYLAHERGVPFRVYSDETRPLLQGSRLTAWELQRAGIDVTTICDNMAAAIMQAGLIDVVIVGTDRVAANGDVANKIGTLGVAILAQHFGVPFYVACPASTIDLRTAQGSDIVIEERGAEEVTHFGERLIAPENIQVRNPAFDVTPASLVTGIITEQGILQAPYDETLRAAYAGT
jgi:methylthioribose-1-phosphate isomerase